jgi:hypothetical protein
MKKTFLLISALAISTFVFSQSASFGIKGGLNLATIGGDSKGAALKPGFHAGIFGLFKTSDRFGFQPEIIYSQQGAQASSNHNFKVSYDYVNIPLMLNVYPAKIFFIQFGPQLGILTAGKIGQNKNTIDVHDQLNSVDFSACVGFGFDLSSTIIGIRYNAGLANTANDPDDKGKYTNQVVQFSLGFKFH